MAFVRVKWRKRLVRATPLLFAAMGAAGCVNAATLNPLAFGKLDATSAVAADVSAAERTPGPYPKFSHVPPVPKDVRPAIAWRNSVAETWALKRRTEAQAAAIPFGLTVGDAQGWADAERVKIPSAEMTPPAADAADQTAAFAAAAQARATPPPPPK
jgi:hypothetical protein